MKKVYYQNSIFFYICLAICIAFPVAIVCGIIWIFIYELPYSDYGKWLLVLIAAMFLFFFLMYEVIRLAKHRIILKEDEIYVPQDWGSKNTKVQYETHISYSEIVDIYIEFSYNNSLNMPIHVTSLRPITYIVFECNDGKCKAINALYYRPKRKAKIIDDILLRAKEAGNELPISTEQIINDYLEKDKNLLKNK